MKDFLNYYSKNLILHIYKFSGLNKIVISGLDITKFLLKRSKYSSLIEYSLIDDNFDETNLRFKEIIEYRDYKNKFEIGFISKNSENERNSLSEIVVSAYSAERENFDLYGVTYRRDKDLRRILTSYGLQGNPLQKDFPVSKYREASKMGTKGIVYNTIRFSQSYRTIRLYSQSSLYRHFCTSLACSKTKILFLDLYKIYGHFINSVNNQKRMIIIYLHTAFPSLPGNPHKITRHMLNTTSFYGLELYNLRLTNRPFKLYLTSPKSLKGLRIGDMAFSIKYSDKDYLSEYLFSEYLFRVENTSKKFQFDFNNISHKLDFLLKLICNYKLEAILVNYLYSQVLKRRGTLITRYEDTFMREHASIFINTLLNNIIHSLMPENIQYPLASWFDIIFNNFFSDIPPSVAMNEIVLERFVSCLKNNILEAFIMHCPCYIQVEKIYEQTTHILKGFFSLFANNESVPYSLELFNLGKLLMALCDMEVQRGVFKEYWDYIQEPSRGLWSDPGYFAGGANQNVRIIQFHMTIFCLILSYLYSFLMNILDYVVSINALFIQPCKLEEVKSKVFKITGTSNFIFTLEALLKAREFDQESFKRLLTDKKNEIHLKNLTLLLKNFNSSLSINDITVKNLNVIGKWPCITIVAFDELLNQIRELHDMVSSYGFPIPINLRLQANNSTIAELKEVFKEDVEQKYTLQLLDQNSFDLLMKKLINIDKNNLEELSSQFMFLHYRKASNNYVRVIKLDPITFVNLNE
jgi:NADH:ubiquinone oxidoreductase subunit C